MFRSKFSAILIAVFIGFASVLMGASVVNAQNQSYDTSRLISIGGSITEIIYALGEEDRLIARDTTSREPVEAMKLPDVGYIRRLSPEGVLSVNPTAIIALEGSGPKEAIDVLQKASVPFIIVPESYDAEGIVNKIRKTGEALNVPEKAAALIKEVQADLASAQAAGEASDLKNMRVLFVLSTRVGRITASGFGTAADGIIKLAGATNVIDQFQGYKQLSNEAIIKAAPDVILMMARGGDHGAGNKELFGNPSIAATPAGEKQNIVRMNGLYLLGFGPRTANAIRDLSQALSEFKG